MSENDQRLSLQVVPEQEGLVQGCYEALGYKLEACRPQDHGDTTLVFRLEEKAAFNEEKFIRCRELLGRLDTMNRQAVRYYLHLVCGVGLAGAVSIGLSFVALQAGIQWLFVVLLLLGLFGCTVTLYLRPSIYKLWMKKHGGEVPGILAELESLLGIRLGRADA